MLQSCVRTKLTKSLKANHNCRAAKKTACIKLTAIDQDVFLCADKAIIFPVDNKWGTQGWTLIDMSKVRKELFVDALTTAYCTVAPKKIAEQIRPNGSAENTIISL